MFIIGHSRFQENFWLSIFIDVLYSKFSLHIMDILINRLKDRFHKIKKEWIDRFDPDHAYLKQAVRTAMAVLIALIVFRWQSNWKEGYWIVLAAAFLLQTRLGKTLTEQVVTVLSCTLFAAILAYIAGFFWHNTFGLALYLSLTVFVATYFNVVSVNIAISTFFINLFVIMSAGIITNLAGQIERPFMIGIGGCIAASLCFLWPTKSIKNWQNYAKIYFFSLSELNNTMVNSYLHHEYHLRKNEFENKLHERRNRVLRHLNFLRHSYQPLEQKFNLNHSLLQNYRVFIKKSEYLYKAIIALGNVRHRITQAHHHYLLELKIDTIHDEISQALQAIASCKKSFDLEKLHAAVLHFQKLIVQVPIEDQKIFMAFIHIVANIVEALTFLKNQSSYWPLLCSKN